MEEVLSWVALVITGFGVGLYGVLVGAGGGFILVPLLVIFWGLDHGVAAGTGVTAVWVNAASVSQAHFRQRRVNLKAGLIIGGFALPGSIAGAILVDHVSSVVFTTLFGILLLSIAALLVLRPAPSTEVTESSTPASEKELDGGPNSTGLAGMGLVVGVLSSFFGIGGGFMLTPVLVYYFRMAVPIATATVIFALVLFLGTASATHLARSHVQWDIFLPVAIGIVAGGQIAARIAHRISGPYIIRMLAVGLIALGLELLREGFAA
jgi:uncharacterized membrane protein YfcA